MLYAGAGKDRAKLKTSSDAVVCSNPDTSFVATCGQGFLGDSVLILNEIACWRHAARTCISCPMLSLA